MVVLIRLNIFLKKFIVFNFMIDRYYWLLLLIKVKFNENIIIYFVLVFKNFK